MKANAPKRKVFQDAVDLISPENIADNGQVMISVEKIVPFIIIHSVCMRGNALMIWWRVSESMGFLFRLLYRK